MKTTTLKMLATSMLVGAVLFSTSSSFAQGKVSRVPYKTADEKQAIEALRKEGFSEADIEKWLIKRKKLIAADEAAAAAKKANPPKPTAAGFCSDLGGEAGWSVWEATTGNYASTGVITWGTPGPPTAPRFNLTSGAAADACTPGGGGLPLPVVAPSFGNASIKMGEHATNGSGGGCSSGCAERLTFDLQVQPQDTNFVYAYALVIDNPAGHTLNNQPFAEIYLLDANGDTVNCSHHLYHGDPNGNIPKGMFASTCTQNSTSAYLPWTMYGINLVAYIGTTVKVVIVNVDCALGGHFCHSYWDFLCPPVTGSQTPFCVGQPTTLIGPPSVPGVTFTYSWYHNGQLIPGATSQSITPTPAIGDTFSVYVQEPSGCNFWYPFAPEPTDIKADFTNTGTCGKYNFTDKSTVTPASATNTVVAWSWSFPGGSPATSTSQNPTNITYPPGTYTITLISTSTAGCKDTVQHSIVVGGFPTAAVVPSTPCLGSVTTLTDGSVPLAGDPLTAWSWTIPGGTPSSASTQNTTTQYATAGTHIVTLVVTSQAGCKDTITQQVIVYNPPVANFSAPDSGCSPVCVNYTDLSTSTDGTVNAWQWTFPGGTPTGSAANNPQNICYYTPGSYSVSLIVTTTYGCKDTVKLPMIKVHPWPNADFGVAPTTAPTTDPVFNFFDKWSSDVVKWSWNFGDNDSDFINTDPVHSYSASATENDFYSFNVCIRVENQYTCWDTICKVVELIPEFTFYIPNTFTPNGDNMNEWFYGKSRGVKEYSIWVFDRWGNQIWDCHKSDQNTKWDSDSTIPRQEGLSSACQWDGKVVEGGVDMGGGSHQLAQEDVYVWKVRLTDIFDKKHMYVGHVNVVR